MWRRIVLFALLVGLFLAVLYIPGASDYVEHFGHALFYNWPVGIIGGFLLAPGSLFVVAVWHGILRQSSDPFGEVANPALLVFVVVFSWVFWSVFISRFLKFIGLWNPFGSSVYKSRPVILRAIVFIGGWWEILSKFGRQATGGWAGLLEVLSCRFKDGDIFLGRPRFRIGGGMLRPIGIPTIKHMVTIAGTGAGKSTGALIPNLCLHKGSLLCVDPKGELARITAARRGRGGGGVTGMGQDVYVLDPFRITGIESASYNVFDEMARIAERDINSPVSYAAKVAEALVEITGRDPYWDRAARRVLMGLILYVFQGPPEKHNLLQVRRLLMEGDKDGFEAGVRAGYISREDNDTFDAMLLSMTHSPDGPYRDAISYAATSLLQMGPNQLGAVLSIAQEHTSFLDLPQIKRVSLSSDFLLEDLKDRPMSVYLSIPLNEVSGVAGRWLRMFVLLLIDMMIRVQTAPKPPILLAIDEFPSLGKLDGIEVVAPGLRSYGVRFWVIGQDIEQFKSVYPDSWNTLIGGAEAVQFMGIKDPETVKMVVEFLDRHVVNRREGEGQSRRNVAEERNLLDTNQVSRILYKERKNQIVWRGDQRPMMLKVTPYFEYMPWWYYSADTRYPEKWNRQIWRSGKVKPAPSPSYKDKLPAAKPPALPPARPVQARPPQARPAQDGPNWAESLLNINSQRVPTNFERWDRARAANLSEENFNNLMHLPLKEFNAGLDALTRGEKLPASLFPVDRPKPQILSGSRYDMSEDNRRPMSSPRIPRLPDDVMRILNPPPVSRKSGGDPIDELDAMVGLESVKAQVKKTISLIKLGRARDAAGLPRLELTHHLVFTGNPGTGKTSVARIVGRIYKIMGLLKSGHMVEVDRADLVASYEGQTAPQVKEVVERATDGILFIDEAYSLARSAEGKDSYGAEAISTLLKLMEDRRDRLVVIAAGYRAEMATFINSNPGLASRFKTFIDFPDYTPTELMEILQNICTAAGCQMSMDAMRKAAAVMMKIDQSKGFGNGRAVRNIFEDCVERQALRLSERGRYGKVDLTMIEAADVPNLEDLKM